MGNQGNGRNSRRKFSYKGMLTSMLGIPISGRKSENKKKHPAPKRFYLKSFGSHLNKDPKKYIPRNLLLMYDIPHTKKKERDWFRRQLKALDFIMIQKSVWIGPSPLPANFSAYVKEIDLESQFKTIKLAKPYSFIKPTHPFKI